MKVSELVKHLNKLPQDSEVKVSDVNNSGRVFFSVIETVDFDEENNIIFLNTERLETPIKE